MGSDADGVLGKIKDKANAVLSNDNGMRGDADPDVDYEPTPDQHILHDGMVVLSDSQADEVGDGGGGDRDGDGEGADRG
jgi:hypothetical protein